MGFLRRIFDGGDRGTEISVESAAGDIECRQRRRTAGVPDLSNALLSDHDLAVLDVETTGLYAEGTDRIIEISVVHLDGNHQVTDEWTTLVNPGRDLGPTRIHGIRGRHVLDAPPFEDVADDLVQWLAGRVVIAHNGSFDERFLRAEFGRLDLALPPLPIIDTYRLTGRRLIDACRELGVPHKDEHVALGDARATAALFRTLLETRLTKAQTLADLGCTQAPRPPHAWPRLIWQPTAHGRDAAASATSADVPAVEIRPGMTICFTGTASVYASGGRLDRADIEALARRAGFEVRAGVTKKHTDLVVAADLDSLSGKAKTARKYGIPIVGHGAFWRAAGVDVSVDEHR